METPKFRKRGGVPHTVVQGPNGVTIHVNDDQHSLGATAGNAAPIQYDKIHELALQMYPMMVKALIWLIFSPVKKVAEQVSMVSIPVQNARSQFDRVIIYLGTSVEDPKNPASWTEERLNIAFKQEVAHNLQAAQTAPPLSIANGLTHPDVSSLLPVDAAYHYGKGFTKWVLHIMGANPTSIDNQQWFQMAFVDTMVQDALARENDMPAEWCDGFIYQAGKRNIDYQNQDAFADWAKDEGSELFSRWLDVRRNKQKKTADSEPFRDMFKYREARPKYTASESGSQHGDDDIKDLARDQTEKMTDNQIDWMCGSTGSLNCGKAGQSALKINRGWIRWKGLGSKGYRYSVDQTCPKKIGISDVAQKLQNLVYKNGEGPRYIE